MKIMSRIISSPLKLFVADLDKCKRTMNEMCFVSLECQRLRENININFEHVWLQGCIISNPINNEFVLNDGSGDILIKSYNSREADKSWIVRGAVCLVLGQPVGGAVKAIVPLKLVNLQGKPFCERAWALEVAEAKRVLSDPPPKP